MRIPRNFVRIWAHKSTQNIGLSEGGTTLNEVLVRERETGTREGEKEEERKESTYALVVRPTSPVGPASGLVYPSA